VLATSGNGGHHCRHCNGGMETMCLLAAVLEATCWPPAAMEAACIRPAAMEWACLPQAPSARQQSSDERTMQASEQLL